MNEEKIDRRVRRTRKQLEEALIRLLQKKDIQRITVSELAAEADITRATFYQHYQDPYDMLKNMQDEIIEHVIEIINVTTGGDAYGFFVQLFEYMGSDEVRPEVLTFNSGQGTGFERIGQAIHNNYMLRWAKKFTEEQAANYKYYRYYITFGCVSVVENWVKGGKLETPEQMAKITYEVLPKSRMYLMKNNFSLH